jgi:hypothetical protein
MDFQLLRISEIAVRTCLDVGRVSVVGIAISYGLDGTGIEPRLGQEVCSSPKPGTHTLLKGVLGLFPWIRRPVCVVDYPPHLAPSLGRYTPTPPLCRMLQYREKFASTLTWLDI